MNFNSFIDQGQNTINDVNKLTASLNTYNSTAVSVPLSSVIRAIEGSSGPDRDEVLGYVTSIQTANNEINSTLTSVSETLNSFNYSQIINSVDFYEQVKFWTIIGILIAVVLMLVLVCCVNICMSPTLIIIMVVIVSVFTGLMWIVTGATFAFTITLSDVCYNPDGLIRNLTSSSSGPVRETLDYFISCEQSCQPSYAQDVRYFELAHDNYTTYREDIREYISNYAPSVADDFMRFGAAFDVVPGISNNVTYYLLTCTSSQGFHEYYLNALNYLCTEGQLYMVIMFALVSGIAISLFVVICCVTCFAGQLINTNGEVDDFNNEDIVAFDHNQTASWTTAANTRRLSYNEPYAK
jgi:uncharacterized membrane protein